MLVNELEPKRFGLLNELVPGSGLIGVLLNPKFPPAAQQAQDVREAARTLGRPVLIVNISSDAELDNIVSHRAHAALGFEERERVVCFRKQL